MADAKVLSNKKSQAIRTIVAYRNPLAKEALSKILEEDKGIEVVSGVLNLIDLIESCKQFDFDILLLDVELKGLNLTKILGLVRKNKSAKVILLIDNNYSEKLLINGIRSGIRGYVHKNADSLQLITSVKAVYDGELWAERKLMGKVVDRSSYPTKKVQVKWQIYDITKTEIKIIKLALNGMTNKEIADELYISEQTVKSHLYKAFKKLKVKKRSELILFGIRHGFVPEFRVAN